LRGLVGLGGRLVDRFRGLGGGLVGGGRHVGGGFLGCAGDFAHGLAGGGGSGFGTLFDHLAGGGNGVGGLGAGGAGGGSGLGGILLGGRGFVLAGRQRRYGCGGDERTLGVDDDLLSWCGERKSRRCRRLSVTVTPAITRRRCWSAHPW